jgi:hypothetical protein
VTFNINQIAQGFKTYVSNYDFNDSNIAKKYFHSIQVSNKAKEIAESLNLSAEDIYIATVIGYLHDVARFEQWTRFETFTDKLSFDHGEYASKILFEEGLIKSFDIDEKYYDVIKIAIYYHNKYEIDQEDLMEISKGEQTHFNWLLTHCEIVRDADKLDLFKIMSNATLLTLSKNLSPTGYSSKVIETLNNKTSVEHKYVKTILDRAIGHLAMAYDLNFDFSKNEFIKNNYNLAIVLSYESILPKQELDMLKDIVKKFSLSKNQSIIKD